MLQTHHSKMQSSSSEGIYASLQTRCFSPAQSPHELQKGVSSNSLPNMNQGLELTNFTEPQLQHLWDFPGELEGIEGFDTLADLGLFEDDGLGLHDGLDSLVVNDGNAGIPLQEDITRNDIIYPAQEQTGNEGRHSSQSGREHTLTKIPDVGKHTLKRPFDSIGDATNTPIDESSGTAKRQCHISTDGLEARLNNSYHVENDPSPCGHSTSMSQHTSHSSLTAIQGASISPPLPSMNRSDTSEENGKGESLGQHTLSLPQSTRQLPNDSSRAQRESSVDSLFDDIDNSTIPTPTHQLSLPGTIRHTKSSSILSPESPLPVEEPAFLKPRLPKTVSEIIRKNNNIESQDVVNSMHREVFTMPRNAQKYISPYPRMGGPLGYLPSTPVVHVKCVEVAKDTVANRMNQYRKIVYKLRYDRDKYLWQSTGWNTVDPKTGKTKAEKMREECSALRRSITIKNRAVNEAMAETEFWRNKYRNLEVAYNNLTNQYKAAIASQKAPGATSSQSLPTSQASSQPVTRAPSISTTTSSEPVSIDLTAEEPEITGHTPQDQTPHHPEPPNSALSRMRQKKYSWLNNDQRHRLSQPATQAEENEENEDEPDDELSQMLMQELEASA